MAVNKNFVVKNGLEVNSNLILADASQNSVGIGTSNIDYKFHVVGGIGATDLYVTGIATFPYVSLTGTVAAGSSLGESGQYLVRSGAGVTWQDLPTFRTSTTVTATASQTSFSFSYTVGLLDVFINGVKLSTTEYTATDGANIVLNQPCFGDETVELISYSSVNPGYAFTGIYGVTVKEEGSIVGNSGQIVSIDFVGAAVTAVGSGAGVTVYITDTGGGGESYWEETSAGINTISNVGIATTNPRFALEVGPVGYADTALWVNGNARVTGILTVGTASIILDGDSNTITVPNLVVTNSTSGVTASGVGITIKSSAVDLGVAEVIDFGGSLNVSFTSGIATVTATGGGESYWTSTSAGIHTLGNVGIGTTNPTSALTVKGNTSLETLSVSGVSTFSQGADVPEVYSIGFGDGLESVHIYKESGGASSDAVINYYGSQNLKVISDSFVIQDKSNNQKFRSIGAGVTVTGTTFTNELSVSGITSLGTSVGKPVTIDAAGSMNFPDRGGGYGNLIFGDGGDLEINAAGTTAQIQTASGSDLKVVIGSNSNYFEIIGYTASKSIGKFTAGAGAEFYYDGSKKFETLGAGVSVYGTTQTQQLNVSGVSTFGGRIDPSSDGILFDANTYTGPDSPLQIWVGNSGGARYFNLNRNNSGGITFDNSDHPLGSNDHRANSHLFTTDGNDYYALFYDGSVKLYHPGSDGGILSQKFETIGAGVTVTGTTYTNDLSASGITTSVGGFTSGIGVTDPVQITVSGNVLTFTVAGVGSTSLTLY